MATKQKSLHRIIYRINYYLVPLLVLLYSIINPGIDGYARARLGDMIIGKAYRPYVYRVLVPSIIRLIKTVVPRSLRSTLATWVDNQPQIHSLFEQLQWDATYLIEYVLVIIVLYLSLLAFCSAMKYLMTGLSEISETYADWFSLITVLVLPVMFKYYNYIYDFPQLFLFTLALGLMARKKWDLFLVVYIFACFNKETTVLLSMIFFIHRFKDHWKSWNSYWKYLFVQGFLFAFIRLLLMYLFKDNPGSMVEFHLYDYNMILFRKMQLTDLIIWLPFVFLVFYRWNRKPLFLRHGIWILVPLVGLTLFLGFIDELRDYYEAYPVVLMLMGYSVAYLLKMPVENISYQETTG